MNKIVFELCEEDRQRLDAIISGLAKVADQAVKETAPLITEATATLASSEHPADASITHLEPPTDAPAPTQPEPAAVEPTPEVKPVSLAEFQKAVTQAVAKGVAQKQAAKKIINKYAPSVSEIPEGKRAEVMAELANL
jgi:hypothetical protein